jgi:hypothetical protein
MVMTEHLGQVVREGECLKDALREGGSCVDIWRNKHPGKRNSQCEGPEVGMHQVYVLEEH